MTFSKSQFHAFPRKTYRRVPRKACSTFRSTALRGKIRTTALKRRNDGTKLGTWPVYWFSVFLRSLKRQTSDEEHDIDSAESFI